MKQFLEFDDPGAADDEPAKGVTVGDIRAWHDRGALLIEALQAVRLYSECSMSVMMAAEILDRIDVTSDAPKAQDKQYQGVKP